MDDIRVRTPKSEFNAALKKAAGGDRKSQESVAFHCCNSLTEARIDYGRTLKASI